jgi:membrane fusion protein (multidrug efflux system)
MMFLRTSLLVLFGIGMAAVATAADNTSKAPPSVVVAPVVSKDVSERDEYVGRAQAKNTVQLQARVEGFLEKKDFTEGAMVKKGQLLFVIEQAPYQATLSQNEASLAGAQATLKNEAVNLKRQKILQSQGDVSVAGLDTAIASQATAHASVKEAQAKVDTAKINLGYTEIRSPIDGRISAVNIDVGNLVSSSSGTLATVTSVDPIYVNFNPAESKILEQRRKGIISGNEVKLTPRLIFSDGSSYAHAGSFDYVDTTVSQTTNTVKLRAVFPNPDNLLTPGQYVRVVVKPQQAKTALVVPQNAVQLDKSGHYVLTVDGQDKVVKKQITVGAQIASDWVVTAGLSKGDRVIVGGLQKVSPGEVVKVAKGQS